MDLKDKVIEKWSGQNGIRLQFPASDPWPDPDNEKFLLEFCMGVICEVGCGVGRIAKFLSRERYIGVDINEQAIQKAKEDNPLHEFKAIKYDDMYPKADTYLFYTVLLHVPDNELQGVIERCANRVVVFESMRRQLRQTGNKEEFQRDPDEYDKAFEACGFTKVCFLQLKSNAHPGYRNWAIYEEI